MAEIVVPEDLTAMVDADLTALSDSIRTEAEMIGADAAASDEALAQVEKLVADYDRVANEIAARSAQRKDRADRVDAALSRLAEATPELVAEEGDMADAIEVAPMSVDEPVEFAAD